MVSFGLLDLTLPSPVENLPLDEALLEDLEENESHSIHREAECGTLILDGNQRARSGMNWSAFAWIKLKSLKFGKSYWSWSSSGHNEERMRLMSRRHKQGWFGRGERI